MPSEFLISSIFLLIGVGVLLPWNAFISAKPYFQSRLCDTNNADDPTSLQDEDNVELWFGVVYNSSAVLALGLIIIGQWIWERRQVDSAETAAAVAVIMDNDDRLTDDADQNDLTLLDNEYSDEVDAFTNPDASEEEENEKRHSFWMVRLPLSVYVLVFFATAVVVLVPSIPPSVFLQFTLASLAFCGPGSCIGNAGILATAGLFPARVGINPFFQGQAVGGLAVAVANFVAAIFQDASQFREAHCSNHNNQRQSVEFVTLPDVKKFANTCIPYRKPDWVTFAYFGLGSVVLIACLAGYAYIEKYHQRQYNPVQDAPEEMRTSIRGIELHGEGLSETHPENAATQSNDQQSIVRSSAQPRRSSTGTRLVWVAISGSFVTIFLTFAVTLALYPGWTSTLRSARQCKSKYRLLNDLYTPMSFVIFNSGDLLGRFIAPLVPIERVANLSRKLVVASCLRFIFMLLFLFCESGVSRFAKIEFSSDLYSFAVQLVFAVSNGLFVSLAFMHGSGQVPATTAIQQKVSEWLNLAVGGGLLAGSLLSFPFARIASGHW